MSETEQKKQKRSARDGEVVSVNIALPKSLHTAIAAKAAEDERTVSHFIVRYLKDSAEDFNS